MIAKDQLQPILQPTSPVHFNNDQILLGKPVPAIDRVKIMSPEEYEDYICEWIHGHLAGKYSKIGRFSGPGDLGRDVVGYADDLGTIWDNFQCKHYDSPLAPSDIWIELGKLTYYTFDSRYSVPRKYLFVAPKGVGPKLGGLLEKPDELRDELISNWDGYCAKGITEGKKINLEGKLKAHVESFNLSIVEALSPQTVLEEHKHTRWHALRFGGGLNKPRPTAPKPPANINSSELRYIGQLIEAYNEHTGGKISDLESLAKHVELSTHFVRQRESFYEAESLRQFSRDSLPDNGKYEELLGQFLAGIADVIEQDHSDGLKRLREAVRAAQELQISGHMLATFLKVQDRCGICHQLANEDRVRWIRKK